MSDRYSLARKDKKIAGVCSTLGDVFNIDPTFLRIAFVAFAVLIEWEIALFAYVGIAIYFAVQRKKATKFETGASDFDRMSSIGKRRGSVHDLRTKLDENDRRMMAIDHHIASQKNNDLAREIEALRKEGGK